jgi:adenylate kinase family enzyme
MVVGSGGAGKSTLAREVGTRLGLPVVHLDRHYWRPGWVEPEPAAWRREQQALVARDAWVIDGNYGSTLDVRLARADLVVFLDLGPAVCLVAVLRRWLRNRGGTRPDMAEGCAEKVDREFLTWVWSFRRQSRPRLLAAIEQADAGDRLVRLRSRRAARAWMDSLPGPARRSG